MMTALLRYLVLFLVSALLHQYAEAVSQSSGSQQNDAFLVAQARGAPIHSNRFGGPGSAFQAYPAFRAGTSNTPYPSFRAGSSIGACPTFGASSSVVANSSGAAGSSIGANSSGIAGVPSLVFTVGRSGTTSRRPPRRPVPKEPKPFACPDCTKSYANQRSLTEHKKSHETDETTCPFCQVVCSKKGNLKAHIQSAHPGAPLPLKGVIGRPPVFRENEPGAFVCGKCGKIYASSSGLHDHERCHETLDTHCFHCKRTLASKASYRVHMKRRHPEDALAEEDAENRQYEEDNPVKCDQCPKRFKNADGLRHHQKYHDGETKCPECGLIFPRKSSLSKHKKSAHSTTPTPTG